MAWMVPHPVRESVFMVPTLGITRGHYPKVSRLPEVLAVAYTQSVGLSRSFPFHSVNDLPKKLWLLSPSPQRKMRLSEVFVTWF